MGERLEDIFLWLRDTFERGRERERGGLEG